MEVRVLSGSRTWVMQVVTRAGLGQPLKLHGGVDGTYLFLPIHPGWRNLVHGLKYYLPRVLTYVRCVDKARQIP